MAVEDYYDIYDVWEDPEVKCRYCGKEGLYWDSPNGEYWVLIDSETDERHDCRTDIFKIRENQK